jgi:hypothetical protein
MNAGKTIFAQLMDFIADHGLAICTPQYPLTTSEAVPAVGAAWACQDIGL